MKNLLSLILLLGLFFLINSCDKDLPTTCLDDLKKEFKSSDGGCSGANIKSYTFNGRTVYAFEIGTCIADGQTKVYDEDCVEICALGGIAGIIECEGISFDEAVFIETLWEK